MQNFTTKTIREIALEMPATTRVFEEFKIDYCCGGRRPFAEACEAAGVSPEIVGQRIETALAALDGGVAELDRPKAETLSDLIDHIVEKHHVFTKTEIVRLTDLMEKVCRRHGEQHAELFDLQAIYRLLCDDLIAHMRKEEMILFPFIKRLEASEKLDLAVPAPPFGTIRNPVRMMVEEHDTAGDLLRKLRDTSNDYALPEGACPSYKALFFGLEDLERDLHRHIHLENNLLFPRAVALEQKMLGTEKKAPAFQF